MVGTNRHMLKRAVCQTHQQTQSLCAPLDLLQPFYISVKMNLSCRSWSQMISRTFSKCLYGKQTGVTFREKWDKWPLQSTVTRLLKTERNQTKQGPQKKWSPRQVSFAPEATARCYHLGLLNQPNQSTHGLCQSWATKAEIIHDCVVCGGGDASHIGWRQATKGINTRQILEEKFLLREIMTKSYCSNSQIVQMKKFVQKVPLRRMKSDIFALFLFFMRTFFCVCKCASLLRPALVPFPESISLLFSEKVLQNKMLWKTWVRLQDLLEPKNKLPITAAKTKFLQLFCWLFWPERTLARQKEYKKYITETGNRTTNIQTFGGIAVERWGTLLSQAKGLTRQV